MPDLQIKCLNKNCRHCFTAKDVNSNDIWTCYRCGKKRKIYHITQSCTACNCIIDCYVQDGTQCIICPDCGNYEPVYAPKFIS